MRYLFPALVVSLLVSAPARAGCEGDLRQRGVGREQARFVCDISSGEQRLLKKVVVELTEQKLDPENAAYQGYHVIRHYDALPRSERNRIGQEAYVETFASCALRTTALGCPVENAAHNCFKVRVAAETDPGVLVDCVVTRIRQGDAAADALLGCFRIYGPRSSQGG